MLSPREEAAFRALAGKSLRAIVIGGSAGSLEALEVLLPAIGPGLQAAVLVVVHLPRDGESMFPSLLAPRCQLPVGEGQDKELAAPGTISFAPPNYHLLLERDGTCSLSVDEPVHHSRPSIDVLFESAAWATDGEALGILLSGANADGAAGLAALVDAGGIAWIQDPESAPMDAMPRAGIAQGRAHRVLSVQEMAAVLARLTAGQRLASGVMS